VLLRIARAGRLAKHLCSERCSIAPLPSAERLTPAAWAEAQDPSPRRHVAPLPPGASARCASRAASPRRTGAARLESKGVPTVSWSFMRVSSGPRLRPIPDFGSARSTEKDRKGRTEKEAADLARSRNPDT
jgi:hypothetical protein